MNTHQLTLPFENGGLLEQICDLGNLHQAFRSVKRNGGTAGVDGMAIHVFETTLEERLTQIKQEVLSKRYKPSPVKRVEIPKPNGKGVRLLGIPTVKDRVFHMAIKQVLEPIIDPTFSTSSYGFRPNRNQRLAIQAAQHIVQSGKEWVVDIDLSKFFDRINHDRLIHSLKSYITDKRVLRIIGMILRSGIMSGRTVLTPKEGSVQGSPLSPLLSNVVLDELDKELERRELQFCRYADDCNIFVSSEKAAIRVMSSIRKFIENRLKLVVNEDKSQTTTSNHVTFLGMTIVKGAVTIAKSSMKKAFAKVKELTQRQSNLSIERSIATINRWYDGWSGYFNMTQFPSQLATIEARIRRRLRARFVCQKKRRKHLARFLIRQGVGKQAVSKTIFSARKTWALSKTNVLHKVFTNSWFTNRHDLNTASDNSMEHWYSTSKLVKFT